MLSNFLLSLGQFSLVVFVLFAVAVILLYFVSIGSCQHWGGLGDGMPVGMIRDTDPGLGPGHDRKSNVTISGPPTLR